MRKKLFFLLIFFVTCSSFSQVNSFYFFDINKIIMPFNNAGVLGNNPFTNAPGRDWGMFDSTRFLFTGGFYLSGYIADTLWANGIGYAAEDYLPGKVGSNPNDFRNKIYIVKSTDVPFGISWQEYTDAVELGADFYDGNNNGIYDPVDLNSNGLWDLNEDAPDIIGDMTAWCVYNDSRPANERMFNQSPLGIEIQQTLFGYSATISPTLANSVFVRYRIENTGAISQKLDSIIFTFYSDPDIGDAIDDLYGTDVNLNSFFCYNDGSDPEAGDNPPAFFGTFLQLPPVYIPGETFWDNNSNNIFDMGVDTPLDTAVFNNGPHIDKKTFPGAVNQNLNSAIISRGGDPNLSEGPLSIQEVRNSALGRDANGEIVNPCSLPYGEVIGIPCSTVDPLFIFSGDPVANIGWINTIEGEVTNFFSSGLFDLEAGKPVDIILAYSVDRGTDALNSITETRKVVRDIINFYQSNFTDIPVSIKDEKNLLNSYQLFQNYPNPFNPATKIKWHSPEMGKNTIKVYDILGNLISVLVDEVKPAGNYEAEFNAADVASGIYFYQLNVNEFSSTKKMLLIK